MEQQINQEPQYDQSYKGEKLYQKERSLSHIALFGLLVGIMLIIGGLVFAANSGLTGTDFNNPSTPSEPGNTSPLPAEKPASEPEKIKPGSEMLPEYVQEFTDVQPLIAKAAGGIVNLINNPDAKNVSFVELKSFILKDDTDEEPYELGVRTCVDFSETLHNNAEQAGIKTAFVGIRFMNEEIGHTLNAFKTTDRGFIFIDCTGEGIKPFTYNEWLREQKYPAELDKIAYIEFGKEYGTVSIDKAESLQYSFYVEYVQDWQKCADLLEDYNKEVKEYNNEIRGKIYYEGSPELASIKAWEAELKEKERIIDNLAEKLGNCLFEPLGIVESVKLYW